MCDSLQDIGARVPSVHAVDVFLYLLTGYCARQRPSFERVVLMPCKSVSFATLPNPDCSNEPRALCRIDSAGSSITINTVSSIRPMASSNLFVHCKRGAQSVGQWPRRSLPMSKKEPAEYLVQFHPFVSIHLGGTSSRYSSRIDPVMECVWMRGEEM